MNRGLFELVGEDVIKEPIMNFTQQFSDALIPTITPVLVLGLTLYYVLKGYLAMTGRSQDAIMEILIHGFKVALIAYIFINTGNFINYSWNFLDSSESLILSAMPGAPASSWNAIDKLWKTLLDMCTNCTNLIMSLDWYIIIFMGFVFIIFLVAVVLLTCGAFGVLLVTTLSLAVVCGFGPLFAGFLFFPITKSWFDGWLKVCLGLALTKVLFAAFLTLLSTIIEEIINRWGTPTSNELGEVIAYLLGIIIVLFASSSMVAKIPTIATSMIGGANLSFAGDGSAMTSTLKALNKAGGTMAAGKLMGSIAKQGAGAAITGAGKLGAALGRSGMSMANRIGRSLQQIGSK